MEQTEILGLPYIIAAQAQKHVTHNESLKKLDIILHLAVESRTQNAPPAAPLGSTRCLIPSSPTGEWASHAGKIAAYQDDVWTYYTPLAGWCAWVRDEQVLLVFDGSDWQGISTPASTTGQPSEQPAVSGALEQLGINATADQTNRLAVAGNASLFTHDGGGHQLKINKAATNQTASVLFQKNFLGRAEIGLNGNDDLSFKISPDGTTFYEGLKLSYGTGNATFNLKNGGKIEFSTYSIGASPRLIVNSDDTDNARAYVSFRHGGGDSAAFYTEYDLPSNKVDFTIRTLTQDGNITFISKSAQGTQWNHMKLHAATGNVGIGIAKPTSTLHANGAIRTGAYKVSDVPSAGTNGAGAMIFVSNEVGGATLAFSDGSVWRRLRDSVEIA